MAHLKQNPTLKDFQEYIEKIGRERGFDKETGEDKFILFVEEVGELARAIRKRKKLPMAFDTKEADELGEEIADLFIYILSLANKYNIDLEEAFLKKEEKNKKRVWKK